MISFAKIYVVSFAALSHLLFVVKADCPPVETVEDFDIDVYASKPWYVHQQAENSYSPIDYNYCVTAEYTVRGSATIWGYTVDVNNFAYNEVGDAREANLCAYQTGESGTDLSKLAVAPCFLPTIFAGPYWIVAYDEEEGYALISGGQPEEEFEGGCRTGTGINNSGLWIFSRSEERNEALITMVRGIASDAGFDLSILNDVDQTNCGDLCSDVEGDFPVGFGRMRDCDWVGSGLLKGIRCRAFSEHCPETCGTC